MKTTQHTAALAIFTILFFSNIANSQTTYKDKGSASTYTLGNGDSLYIVSGTFSGTINTWVAGSNIIVAQNATFKPSSFNDNKSKLVVYGTAVLPVLTTNNGFGLKNFGNITVTGEAAMNGGAQSWTNNFGATITFNGKMALNHDGSNFTNDGTINAKADFYLYSNSSVTNTNTITVGGDFKTSKGTVNNSGRLYSSNGITLSGTTVFTNSCKTIADKGITVDNNNTTVYNSGFLWATNSKSNSTITNSGTIINSGNAKIKAVNFTNWGTITGNAWLYFTGTTTGSGTIGVTGTTTDSIRVYDVSRSNPATIFDTQWGTIRPNVKYSVFAAPDTSASAMVSCSAQFFSASNMATLPVVWNYFDAKLVNGIPVLDWSAAQDPGTIFELQRSYDNASFTKITSLTAETNKSVYQYTDKNAAIASNVIYYRVKAIEPDGQVKFTQVKIVKLAINKNTATQIYPNPFTNQFSISYTGNGNEKITIRIYNGMGQMSVAKTVSVSSGTNTITITEGATLTKGIYIAEISTGNNVITTQKIIKN